MSSSWMLNRKSRKVPCTSTFATHPARKLWQRLQPQRVETLTNARSPNRANRSRSDPNSNPMSARQIIRVSIGNEEITFTVPKTRFFSRSRQAWQGISWENTQKDSARETELQLPTNCHQEDVCQSRQDTAHFQMVPGTTSRNSVSCSCLSNSPPTMTL